MDPTAADVRAGTATYDVNTGAYVWLDAPAQPAVWDSGTGSAVVTVTAPPKDHSLIWLLLAATATWWVLEG